MYHINSKFPFLQVTLNFELKYKNIVLVDIPTNILLTILLSIELSSRCKLKVYMITHTKEKPITTNRYFSQNFHDN